MKKLLIVLLFSFSSLFAFENLTADNFDKKISEKNVIVDFYYTWWPACKALGKSLTKYNTSKKQDVTIYKVNLEEQPELKKRFNINAFPVLLYIKNSKIIAKEKGVRSPEQLEENVIKYFK